MRKLIWNIQYYFWRAYFRIRGKFPSKDCITITLDNPDSRRKLNEELQHFDYPPHI